ncbi:MAG: nucleoside kinase [Oscillospiraceae bacterium]|nr:nucleoside kinase [Oscillospiraceae bacterium]
MKLRIDGREITAKPGQTLWELVKALGLDSEKLSQRPLAAKIAGEVFNLNYVPVRVADLCADRPSIRRAMEASGGEVHLLYYNDPSGREVYTRTAQFVLFLALENTYPKIRGRMGSTIGSALMIRLSDNRQFELPVLKAEMQRLIAIDFPLIRRRVDTKTAIRRYVEAGKDDKARLLRDRDADYFDEYAFGDFADYHYGELAPSSGCLQVWDMIPTEGGFLFLFPDANNPDVVGNYVDMPRFLSVTNESAYWCQLMACDCVADLNDLTRSGEIRELIRVNEALHEKKYAQVADMVCQRGCRAVMLAGPSSSGKTTSANRLATQLRTHGKKPILMSLDDYYIDRDTIAPGPDGKLDLEHINTIDTALFRVHLKELLQGKEVTLPTFNFITGKREWRGHKLQLDDNTVIIVEGLHALNPVLLPEDLDTSSVFRLYVSALLPLNLDDHNRIPSSYLRLLRRTVRDYETRGATVAHTLSMWDSVRRGEHRWIFPYQENADVIFNSSTLYELAVLKNHIYPLLTAVQPEEDCYEAVRAIVKVLNYVQAADVDDEIPPTSLVREFIGGNSYYR